MPKRKAKPPLHIWALTGARAGDNDQVIALAEAIGLPFEVKQLEYNRFRFLGPRILGRSLVSLTRRSHELVLGEPPPDLTISAGHRSVVVVRALRHRSYGRMRAIHVGFPRISPEQFDLVIATPQYAITDHPHLLRTAYALTRTATSAVDPADLALVTKLPQPRRLLVVGGPTLFWNIDDVALLRVLEAMLAEASHEGGSVLVTTSPRTPPSLAETLRTSLDASPVPTLLTAPGKSPRYFSVLTGADSIRITADSVAMISDAVWTGKPVAVVPVAKSPLGRLVFAIADKFRPGERVYPQDLRFFWRALGEIGIGEQPSIPRNSTREQMREVLRRVGPIIDGVQPADR